MDADGAQERAAHRQALVVGGGLAGLAAACELADGGRRVSLLEKRPYLGGRAFSFLDRTTGAHVDNGQHIFMRCCSSYTGFLKKLGCLHKTWVQEALSVPVFGEGGAVSVLDSAPLPAPLHLAPSLLRYRHLSLGDRLRVMYCAAAMRAVSARDLRRLDDMRFYDWLKARRQSDRAIARFWDPIVLPALNDNCRAVSAAQAIMVFQEGFMKDRHAADIGLARVGLSCLLGDDARQYLERRGGRLLVSHSVAGLEGTLEAIEGVRTHNGHVFAADEYIMAVPPDHLLELLPPALRAHDFFRRAAGLRMSPIVNLHLWFDRKVFDLPFATFLGSHIQWVFDRDARDGAGGAGNPAEGGRGQHLVVSLSGAHRYIDMPREALVDLLLNDLRARIPSSREATVLHHVLVRERSATFSPAPGSAAFRLPQRTPVPNLFLAGAWTDTGWPATMESAVRSGLLCAREVLGARKGREEAA